VPDRGGAGMIGVRRSLAPVGDRIALRVFEAPAA